MKTNLILALVGAAAVCMAMDDAGGEVKASKSIIDSKYRARKEPDWLGKFIATQVDKTREVTVEDKNEQGQVTGSHTKTVNDGVDIDKLFALAAKNLPEDKIAKFRTQVEAPGFTGRFRMTVRNMLQGVVKQRHGLYDIDGNWVDADPAFLHSKDAPKTPTHTQDGTKIKVEKPAPAETEAA